MKKNHLIIFISVIVGVLLLITASVIIIINKGKEEEVEIDPKTYIIDSEMIKLNHKEEYEEELTYSRVFTNYEAYLYYFDESVLKEEDFINYNYVVLTLAYDDCGESNLVPTEHVINKDTVDVTVYYDGDCGVCAPIYDYYALKIDKSIDDIDIRVNSIARNKVYCDPTVAYKPIIYLYPTSKTEVNVKLGYKDKISVSYPKYNDGWNVVANPDGTLYDKYTNRNYYALYWEGNNFESKLTDEGFVVKGEDSYKFLEEKLKILGLNEREANEFIIYWLPKLEKNNYNYIRFETNDYIDSYMPLIVNPKPDTVIRVYMIYKPLDSAIKLKEQKLNTPKREGFIVVEWGGSKI